MSGRDEVLAVVGVLNRRDADEFERWCRQQEEARWLIARLVHTVFVLAAAKRWGEGIDLVSVAELVASAARTYGDVVTIHPLLAEGLLRAALGQPEMAEGIPEGHAVVWELVLLAALTAQNGNELPALLDAAISGSAISGSAISGSAISGSAISGSAPGTTILACLRRSRCCRVHDVHDLGAPSQSAPTDFRDHGN